MSTEEKIRQLPPLPDRESFFASLRRSFDEAGLGELLTQEAEERFYILLGYMLDEGSRLNVTAIRSLDEIIAKHFTDSAAVAPYLPQGCSVCDVGNRRRLSRPAARDSPSRPANNRTRQHRKKDSICR